MNIEARLAETAKDVDATLDGLLPTGGPLAEPMRYAVLGAGKRLRPFLTMEAGRMLGAEEYAARYAACALECVHAYSLVHDDLPCMDDDDLRRGKPTVHKAFGEATAVLVGDALQAFAFQILTSSLTHDSAHVRLELVRCLAMAAGWEGMVGGQMKDLAGSPDLEAMQAMKTGALIKAALEFPVIITGENADVRAALMGYGYDLGLAFQIADDLLDAEGRPEDIGKATGKDAAKGKANFVTQLGVGPAREKLESLAKSAKARLDLFGDEASCLKDAVDFVLNRRR